MTIELEPVSLPGCKANVVSISSTHPTLTLAEKSKSIHSINSALLRVHKSLFYTYVVHLFNEEGGLGLGDIANQFKKEKKSIYRS